MTGSRANPGFQVLDEPLPGLYVLQRRPYADDRGSLDRLFASEDPFLSSLGFTAEHVNLVTIGDTGTLKGMHAQHGDRPEFKLITCIEGSIFDACVDVRPESASFGQWFGMTLEPKASISILATAGFAHGVQCQAAPSAIIYVHSDRYRAESEYGIHALDPSVAIEWPLAVAAMSDRDRSLPYLRDLQEASREV